MTQIVIRVCVRCFVNTSCFAVVFRLHSGSVGGFRRLKKRVATTLILTIYYINRKKL